MVAPRTASFPVIVPSVRRVAGLLVGCGLASNACGAASIDSAARDAGLEGGGRTSTLDAAGDAASAETADDAGVSVGVGPWPASSDASPPVPMDDVTVFAFSQVATQQSDPQVTTLAPDMNIRAWQRWDRDGVKAGDYAGSYVAACHAQNVRFIGGTTATALFQDEAATSAQFEDWAARDALGNPVEHTLILSGMYRGTLANPAYREYLVGVAKLQIDVGVDGLFFDEVYGGYQGATYNGDEGFDDYHLTDFNAYLLWRYAGQDVATLFGMTPDNLLRADVPPGDLVNNFNYRTYLASHNWTTVPLAQANPLAAAWGTGVQADPRGPKPGMPTFTDTAEPYRYFRQIIDEVRAYAQQTRGTSIYITANGIWPLVDFQGVGLYDFNHDGPDGSDVNYVPLTSDLAHLDGTQSLEGAFVGLRQRSAALAPGAPVVVFIDWPSGPMTRYQALPATEQEDYWNIYAAEAYASGIFFAFFLADTTGDPTATDSGVMPLFQTLAAFYRAHSSLYHGVQPSTGTATTSLATSVAVSMMDQTTPRRRVVHIVNHDYAAGLQTHQNFTVTLPLPSAPASATLASPDASGDASLPFTYASGAASIDVPSLVAYDVIAVAY